MAKREPRAAKPTRTAPGWLASTSATPIPTRRPTSFSGSLSQFVVHLISLAERRPRACSVDNAEVALEHNQGEVDSCISWLSKRLISGATLTAQIRPKRYDALAGIVLAPARRRLLLTWESVSLVIRVRAQCRRSSAGGPSLVPAAATHPLGKAGAAAVSGESQVVGRGWSTPASRGRWCFGSDSGWRNVLGCPC